MPRYYASVGHTLSGHLKLWKWTDKHEGEVDRLCVKDISQWAVAKTKVAFLSACSTAESGVRGLGGESLDICQASCAAGIPDVIGSM